jgi:hypothetical protein
VNELAASAADIRIKVLLAFACLCGAWIIAGVCGRMIDRSFNRWCERRRRRDAFVQKRPEPDTRSSILQFRRSHKP